MIRISLIAVIFCLLVIHSNANRGKSPGKGKYYLVKTKDSSDDEMPMAPEEDQDEVSAIPVPDHTVNPQALEELEKLIDEEFGDGQEKEESNATGICTKRYKTTSLMQLIF